MSHQALDLLDRRNVYVVQDLHGDWDLFNFALKQLGFSHRDYIISVGDLIDRGEKPFECMSFFFHTDNAMAVRGNHEDMMIRGLLHGDQNNLYGWIQNGGHTWMDEMPQTALEGIATRLDKLPYAITANIGNLKVGICHAEAPMPRWVDYCEIAGKYWKYDEKALWGRNKIKEKTGTAIIGVDYTIHGHSVRPNVTCHANQYWIDTGSVFDEGSGKYALTIAELKEGKPVFHRFRRNIHEVGGFEMCDKTVKSWF